MNELSEQIQTRSSKDDSILEELQGEVARFKKSYRESNASLVEKSSEITKLKQEIRSLKEEMRSFKVDSIREEISRKGVINVANIIDDAINVLQEKLSEAYKDIELLSLDWDKIDAILKTYV